MPQMKVGHVTGRLGELAVASRLVNEGLSCLDMTSQDYGLDLLVAVPYAPLTEDQLLAIRTQSAAPGWEMSALSVAIQVKRVTRPSLKAEHLAMWSQSNLRRPGSCFVAFSYPDGTLRVFDPNDIQSLADEVVSERLSSLNPFANADSRPEGLTFYPETDHGEIGRYFTLWAQHGDILADLGSDGRLFSKMKPLYPEDIESLAETLFLYAHLDDDTLQTVVNMGGGSPELFEELGDWYNLLIDLSRDKSFTPDLEKHLGNIYHHCTWAAPQGREKAFGRHNRYFPRKPLDTIRAFLVSYVRDYGPFLHSPRV